jgi:hypothetical protein
MPKLKLEAQKVLYDGSLVTDGLPLDVTHLSLQLLATLDLTDELPLED